MAACMLSGPTSQLAAQQSAVATRVEAPSRRFEFHSGIWLNLHHFLHALAGIRQGVANSHREALAGAPGDTAGYGALAPELRSGWEAALAYYDTAMAPRDLLFGRGMYDVKTALTESGSAATLRGAALDTALIRALEQAAPAYRALWWPRHQRANREWVAAMTPVLNRYEDTVATQILSAYRTTWPSPIRVDLTGYASWSGAYTTTGPTHIVFSSLAPLSTGAMGMETLFHEALHGLEDSVVSGIARAARATGRQAPRLLSHAIIFYTAGEIVRRTVPRHTPYAERVGIWTRHPWARFRHAIVAGWQPYMEGRMGFDEALAAVLRKAGNGDDREQGTGNGNGNGNGNAEQE